MSEKAFQTRSESYTGKYSRLHYFNTLTEAIIAYESDKSIWKISWNDPKTKIHYRIRPKTTSIEDEWCPASEVKLKELCPSYAYAQPEKLFWVDQSIELVLDLIKAQYVNNNVSEMTEDEENLAQLRMMWADSDLFTVFNEDGSKKE